MGCPATRLARGLCLAVWVFPAAGSDGSEVVISNRRARALLAMLCLAKGEAIDREFLSKLLWAGRFEAHAKASLRQCLLELGKVRVSANGVADSAPTISLSSSYLPSGSYVG